MLQATIAFCIYVFLGFPECNFNIDQAFALYFSRLELILSKTFSSYHVFLPSFKRKKVAANNAAV